MATHILILKFFMMTYRMTVTKAFFVDFQTGTASFSHGTEKTGSRTEHLELTLPMSLHHGSELLESPGSLT